MSCGEPSKLVPGTVEFASSPKATGGGDFTPTVLDDISPPSSPEERELCSCDSEGMVSHSRL